MNKTLYLVSILLILSASELNALKNPAAVYCTSMGYNYFIEKSEEGYCQIPTTKETFSEWDFYTAKAGKEFSYCTKNGYAVQTIDDYLLCAPSLDSVCAVCIIDGKKIPVSVAMNLSFSEGVCGDNKCTSFEDHLSCPKDCPSGYKDGFCDEVIDNRCDPDCSKMILIPLYKQPHDTDCDAKPVVSDMPDYVPKQTDTAKIEDNNFRSRSFVALFVVLGLIAVGLMLFFIKQRN